jgi:hypothetical protein
MEHVVTGCKDCPLYQSNHDDRYGRETKCNHPAAPEQPLVENIDVDAMGNPITPDFCPLNSEPLTILKK